MEDEGREPSLVNFQKLGRCSEEKSLLILKHEPAGTCSIIQCILYTAVVEHYSSHIITFIHFTIILLKI